MYGMQLTHQGSAADSTDQSSRASGSPLPITATRVVTAIVLWLVASGLIGIVTVVGARALALGWATNSNEMATIIAAEVYAILIVALFSVFGGYAGTATALRLRAVPRRAFAMAFTVVVITLIAGNVPYILAGAGALVRDAYLRVGTDGGRLGAMGSMATLLSLFRACVLAPVGEELLFRGAIYGWVRRWSPAWSANALTGMLWGIITGAIGGVPLLVPRAILYGLGLNWIRERTESTLPGIAVHIAHDSLAIIAVYLLVGWH